jgi:hypothetical protein
MEAPFDLDTSWLKEEELLENISTQHEREPINTIRLNTIFINEDLTIERVATEKITLEKDKEKQKTVLKKEQLLKIIQTKRTGQNGEGHYKLIDILVFHLAMDHENIHTIAHLENLGQNQQVNTQLFMKTLPIVDDIVFDDTLFIFHDISAIYIFLQSHPTNETKGTSLKSILKTTSSSSATINKTKKKVQLVIPKKLGMTRKNQNE